HANGAIDDSRNRPGLRIRKASVEQNDADVVLEGAKKTLQRRFADRFGKAAIVFENEFTGLTAVAAEMDHVRAMLEEGLVQVGWPQRPLRDQFERIAVVRSPNLLPNLPNLFAQP